MGKRTRKANKSVRARASNKEKTTRRAKSSDAEASTRERRFRKTHDPEERQEKGIADEEDAGARKVGLTNHRDFSRLFLLLQIRQFVTTTITITITFALIL